MPRMPFPAPAAAAAVAVLLLLPATAPWAAPRAARPASCKPAVPVDVELRVLDSTPGQPAQVETRVTALRPVEGLRMDVSFSGGAAWSGSRRELTGRMDAGARRALPLAVALPAQGHSEIYVKVSFTTANGSRLTRGAYLAFDDGRPARPLEGRASSWNGTPVLEFPAQGVSK
jgi:hypothetical protein